jgi:RNA polymerase sigma-70 factor, TIGR02943 family
MDKLDPTRWLADHGDYLYRVARRQLRSDALAEDAVQETLLAALSARERYSGDASPRTWLTGILKHKIVDLIRRSVREVEIPCDDDGADDIDALFKADGHWAHDIREWKTPEKDAELAQLRQILLKCSDGLKPAMARVFALREIVGLETEEICKELAISSTNCWVLLHRARLFMRACLELNGFAGVAR